MRVRRVALAVLVIGLAASGLRGGVPGSGGPGGAVTGEALAGVVDRAHLGQFWGAVVVRVGGRDVLRRGYGFEGPTLEPIDPGASLFDIGSVSKSLTAAAVMALVDEGALSLETTLAEVFAEEDAGAFGGVTVADLLAHRLGVPDTEIATRGIGVSDRACWVRALGATPVESRADLFSYSNVCYFLAAAVIEVRAGEAFEEAVRSRVMRPAGLRAAGFVGDRSVEGGRATVRASERAGSATHIFAYPWDWGQRGATGVVMTADDAARWVEFAWSGDLAGGAARARVGSLGPGAGYAAGWNVRVDDDGAVWRVGHGGSTGGYQCEVAHYPRAADGAGVTIVVMTNERWGATELERRLARLVAPAPARPVRGGVYLGRYDLGATGTVEIGDRLRWRVMPSYHGRGAGGEVIVDERPTVVLTAGNHWPVMVTMDHADAEALLGALHAAVAEVASHPEAASTPWERGMRVRVDVSGLELGEPARYELTPGSRWEVEAAGVGVVARLVDGASGRALVTVDMDGAGAMSLVGGLRGVVE